ncbi:MAG: NAD-dependent aldehyde dehydrogenase [Acidobacteriaceae bacterium]|nr:NAD-dependent aldehyde dehydrogenase [Acidobacteriaceae bacterium]
MTITGDLLIGGQTVRGKHGKMRAVNPATGKEMEPVFVGGDSHDVDKVCSLAQTAFDAYRSTGLEDRALFLEAIAQGIIDLGDELVDRVVSESGLTRGRIEGERARTCGQLRLFASIARAGRWLNPVIDPALPERQPLPRPDLRSRKIPVGPVAVFGASNFPLAFSVAGGDTAAALAAGCPVVAKSHPSHLGTSELVGRVIQAAVAKCDLPEGVFSLLVGEGNAVGEALVRHPAIQAVAFTGSRRGGLALVAMAAARPNPIPVFAEMSSTNPVFLLPAALAERGAALAKGLVDSATLGVGQFCTKPGIVLGIDGAAFQQFAKDAVIATENAAAGTMLNAGIHNAFLKGAEELQREDAVEQIAEGKAASTGHCAAQAMLFSTTAQAVLSTQRLTEEVFGPTTLLVACKDEAEMLAVAEQLEGQLTATIHLADSDLAIAQRLLPTLERKVGRILVNGFPTGVEVSHAMVHGGPFPSTSDNRATSVGGMAIERFLRPICYQNFPVELLPDALQPENPLSLWRLVDGKLQQP